MGEALGVRLCLARILRRAVVVRGELVCTGHRVDRLEGLVVTGIEQRLHFLLETGLGYLTLDRTAPIHIHVAEQIKEVNDCLEWSDLRPAQWLMDNAGADKR